ncbi:MAG TPA: hypothetical protein VGQ58_09115 [Candidatus Limnocylindrales bacterium]|nr:hypothetical protein [Candidatus Limnocylindrales bacterium]
MLHVYVFGPIAITAGHWVQRGVDTESGARVEIRRVEYEDVPGAPAGVAGLRLLPVSEGIWRADLFRNQAGEIIYHYHPHFEKGDVGQRFFDDLLTSDPVEFVMRRLADLRVVLVDSGAGDVADEVPYAEIERVLPAIREAIERSFEPVATPA